MIIEFFCIQKTQVLWNIYETIMSNRHRNVDSQPNTPFEDENYGNDNQNENKTEITQDQTPVEANTNPTENTQQNWLQSQDSSYIELITSHAQNPSLKLQQELLEVLSLEQYQAEKIVQNRNIKKESQLKVKCYQKKNRNATFCCNNWFNQTL